MRVLVINAGSSSVKFEVFGNGNPLFGQTLDGGDDEGVEQMMAKIPAVLKESGYEEFDAIGHRVAHGGQTYEDSCLIDDDVIAVIESCVPLVPLHNPANLAGIRLAQKQWPDTPQIAVFDTAFHQTMPEHAVIYAVPKEWRDKGVRHYGFHGTSHKYIMQRVAEEMKMPPEKLRIISCHLGNGASVCAIDRGRSVDTSMGMTALGGLVMGSRCGDVDPGLTGFLHRTMKLSPQEVEDRLYHDSGLKSLTGTNDMREIEAKAAAGGKDAQLALDVYTYRIRHYIGAYAAAMNGVDVLAFTGGIGENSVAVRKGACQGLEFLGLHFDDAKNVAVKLKDYEAPHISKDSSKIKVMVTKTREQWMIAKDAERILSTKRDEQKKEARR